MPFLKNPIFVLEGPDGSGKTTLAQEIQRLTGAHYIHLTYAPHLVGNMVNYQTKAAMAAAHLSNYFPVIIDRWVPSETVYSNVFREGKCEADDFTQTHLLEGVGAEFVYVFCQPEDRAQYLEAFNKLKNEREEMYSTAAGVWHEFNKYIEAFHKRGLHTHHYDRFKEPAAEMAAFLVASYPGTYQEGKKK